MSGRGDDAPDGADDEDAAGTDSAVTPDPAANDDADADADVPSPAVRSSGRVMRIALASTVTAAAPDASRTPGCSHGGRPLLLRVSLPVSATAGAAPRSAPLTAVTRSCADAYRSVGDLASARVNTGSSAAGRVATRSVARGIGQLPCANRSVSASLST